MAASTRPASRYPSLDSRSSSSSSSHLSDPSPSSSDRRNLSKNLPSIRRLITNSSSSRGPSDPMATVLAAADSSCALARRRSDDLAVRNGQNLGAMVRKFMEKRSKPKAGLADRTALVVPPDRIVENLKKTAAVSGGKGSNFTALNRKLFQKAGSGDRTAGKVLTEVKANTRTLAMVLRSERELLSQKNEYEAEISELRLLLEEKNREVDKLKDLCLKQREEIKELKDAIFFPDVMNAHLHGLREKQVSELKHAKQVIPTLQKQVTSLTEQLQCLADDLTEVKADKYAARACFDGLVSSPRTPVYDPEAAYSLEFSSVEHMVQGSPDDMFLKDLNPCLTPCFSKTKSKEYDEMMG